MGECGYNGTCIECTSHALEYAETEENLVCCVENTNSIEGWVRFTAFVPSDCPTNGKGSFYYAVLSVAVGVLLLLYFIWMAYRRFKDSGYNQLSARVPARPVYQRYEEYGRMTPAPLNWEEVELDAVVASMEATTAL